MNFNILNIDTSFSYSDNKNLGTIVKTFPIHNDAFVSITEYGIIRAKSQYKRKEDEKQMMDLAEKVLEKAGYGRNL